MDYLKQFLIPFVGLKPGKHQFDYLIDKAFFDEFEYSPVKNGHLEVNLVFDKQESMFVLDFKIHGTAELICDRCLEPFDFPVNTIERVIFKAGDENFENTDDIIVLHKKDYEIDVSKFIYEFINLAIPMIHVHPENEQGESGCNKEVLALLNRLKADEGGGDDPRWNELRKLRDN